MDGASFQFVIFGLIVALVSNFNANSTWRTLVLFSASLLFLGLAEPNPLLMFLPLGCFLLLGYISLLVARRDPAKMTWLVVAVVIGYVWLKKYTFLPASSFLSFPYSTLGMSYIFFRVLHLVIETGDRTEKRAVGLGSYLLYSLNFTTFLSGPIQRYDDFANDQYSDRPIALGTDVVGLQLERIVRGFFKVNVVAMLFDMMRVDALAQITQIEPLSLKLFAAFRLVLVYPFFLYANFSGYIDIVVALAHLMRVRLPENFDRPFSASSVMDFWNRWHITLSNWLKAYVYNPLLLALMRRFPSRAVSSLLGIVSFFVTFFLIGVWHGRTSEFIMFGVLTGAGISINKIWQLTMVRFVGKKRYKEMAASFFYETIFRGLNFVWFAFTLFWFWTGWHEIGVIFHSLSAEMWISVVFAAWIFIAILLAAWERLRIALLSVCVDDSAVFTSRYARVMYASAMGLIAFTMTFLLKQPAPGIVYKVF